MHEANLLKEKYIGRILIDLVCRDKAGKASLTALHKSNAPLVMALCGSKEYLII